MNERQGLIEAIRDGDTASKLIFADWAEEYGDAKDKAHAALIRCDDERNKLQKQIDKLRNERAKLLQAHQTDIFPWANNNDLRTHMGFIHWYDGTEQEVARFLQSQHFLTHPINAISITRCTEPAFFATTQLSRIQELDIRPGAEVTPSGIVPPSDPKVVQAFCRMNWHNLKNLHLESGDNDVTGYHDLRPILGSQPFPHLEKLQYRNSTDFARGLLPYLTELTQRAIDAGKPIPFPRLTEVCNVKLFNPAYNQDPPSWITDYRQVRARAHELGLDEPGLYAPQAGSEADAAATRRHLHSRGGRKDSGRINPASGADPRERGE